MEIVHKVVLDFDVICNVCGKNLDAQVYKNEIIIDPCQTCLEKATEEA